MKDELHVYFSLMIEFHGVGIIAALNGNNKCFGFLSLSVFIYLSIFIQSVYLHQLKSFVLDAQTVTT